AVVVTASTGIAASFIGGSTLHSFAGIGLGSFSVATHLKGINSNEHLRARWLRTKVLVIDESESILEGRR
ncbi:hypothetical protein BDY24DRAFT_346077, partial [Mrakia frigida]|uniref:uncharacterized protein n=1 Tax=Mrakia frigida TaxID=29902 RepID=UPI003FCC0674